MTEQVDTKISSKHFYDTSILQFNNSIYYFKRIYGVVADSEDESRSQKSGSLGSINNRKRSGNEIASEAESSFTEDKSEESDIFSNSYL